MNYNRAMGEEVTVKPLTPGIFSKDLAALSAATLGSDVVHPVCGNDPDLSAEDPARTAKIAELKAKFGKGELIVDTAAVAARIVDFQLEQPAKSTLVPASESTSQTKPKSLKMFAQ